MKRILLSLFALVVSIAVFAQTNGQNTHSSIRGTMLDMESEPLGYGELVLYNEADSSFVGGVASNIDGDFLMEDIKPGNYYATLSYVGYRDKIFSELKFSDTKNSEVDFGTVNMRLGSVELAEIIVSGDRNVMEVKMDKRIFNASKSLVSKGSLKH